MLLSLGLSFFAPLPVSAGVFSFLSNILGFSSNKLETTSGSNLQNTQFLQAVLNSDPTPSKGGGDITIVNGSALLPDTGPYGSMADISDTKPESGQIGLYVVRDGDSLSQIAQMFDVSVNTIIWANDIKRGSLIKPGQTLLILPVSGVKYIVKKDDTIQGIAKKFKGDTDDIIQFNGLSENGDLSVGSEIIIPNGENSSYVPSPTTSSAIVRGTGGPAYSG